MKNIQSAHTPNNASTRKKFSILMREIDYNAYAAYKQINENRIAQSHMCSPNIISTLAINSLRYPFGPKDKRTLMEKKNIGEWIELEGKMRKRRPERVSSCDWEDLIQRTEGIKPTNTFANKASTQKYYENKLSGRTVHPNIDYTNEETYGRHPGIKSVDSYKKSTAVGSIGNLLSKTPEYQKVRKKCSAKITEVSKILNHESPSPPIPRHKVAVNLEEMKRYRDYAGVKLEKPEKKKKNSVALEDYVKNFKSEIFANGKSSTRQVRKKALSIARDVFASSIVFGD